MYTNSIYSTQIPFNSYFVTDEHAIYTNLQSTSASFIHHYFGTTSTRDLSDGSLIIAAQNLKDATRRVYDNLDFNSDGDFWGRVLQSQSIEGHGFFKSVFLSATSRNSEEWPLNIELYFEMILDSIMISERQNAILFDMAMRKLIAPIRMN